MDILDNQFLGNLLVTVICSIVACSGFWTFLQHRADKKDARTEMLIGLGHDRIIYLGMQYLSRGYITEDEYENLHDYLYIPYKKMGGNGSAERIMKEVDKLPIRPLVLPNEKEEDGT